MRTLMMLAGLAVGGGWTGTALGQLAEPAQPEKAPAPQPEPAPALATPSAEPVKETPAKAEVGKPAAEAPSTQDPAAREKFEQFERAMKELKSVTFTAEFSVDGRGKEMFGTIDAKVLALQGEKGWSYRTTGKGKRTAKSPEAEFDISYAEGNASWLDKDAKKLMCRPTATARGKVLETASNLRTLGNMFQSVPFSKEKSAKELTLRDAEKVGSVDCDVLVSTNGGTAGDMVFYLGKEDHLPRKIVSERSSSAGTTMSILEFKDFKANDKVEASALEITAPEGYTKEELHSAAKPVKGSEPKAPPAATAKPEKLAPAPEGGKPALEEHGAAPGPAEPMADGGTESEGMTPAAPPSPAPSPTPSPTPAPAPSPVNDTTMPAFELKTADGKAVTNETLRGQPAVILFFGTWSLSSKKAYPELKATAERYKDKARVYAAAVRQRDAKEAQKALAEAGVDSPLLLEADKLAEHLRIGVFPAVYVIGADGEILKHPSAAKVDDAFREARAALDAALGMTPTPQPTGPVDPDGKPAESPAEKPADAGTK